ncbi:MAG: hypothetical protein ACLVIY_07545 [Anaerobutyricum soehngenii]
MKPDYAFVFQRAGAEQHYKPGIFLKEKDGEWKLYKVKKLMLLLRAATAAAIEPKLCKNEKIYKVPLIVNAYKRKEKNQSKKWSYHIRT